ncbi:hypothetical protein LO80_01010 [Candidatus Francisella endociliophora]|uniref:Uncharacterized protein n=1 Tax=Candidatus Francisella endociliophora TaxID=653937 RepID=A0A097EM94_9GAMM|nr:hypothetical protein [Francisella sp. FSC1006]AIT08692.1 hypothetical protein LO80_01010 [Francisella sp. FSC1006]
MNHFLKKFLVSSILCTSVAFAYDKKSIDKEQFVVNLDDPYAYFSRESDQTEFDRDFLVVYNTDKVVEGALISSTDYTQKHIGLPKELASKSVKIDQLVNIGYNNILVLVTNEKSNSNFAYIYSIEDLLNGDKKDKAIKLKLPNGYNPTITYNNENWSNHIAQYFTYAVTSDKDKSSPVSAYLLQSKKINDEYQTFTQISEFQLPSDIDAEHIELATFSKPNPTPGHGYDFQSALVYKNADLEFVQSCILTPGQFNNVTCGSIKNTNDFENPAIASLMRNENMALFANGVDKDNVYATTFNKNNLDTTNLSNIKNQGYNVDIAAIDTSPNFDGVTDRNYTIIETHRSKDNSVWANIYSYTDKNKEFSLEKSIVIE